MSSVLVVVIVGVIIVAIAVATVVDGPKPPTRDEPPRREPAPAHLAPRPTSRPTGGAVDETPIEALDDAVDEARGLLARARAALLLGAAVVVLGSLGAALVGGVLFVGYHTLRSALG